jgi:type IV pilus assembly protein PilQ
MKFQISNFKIQISNLKSFYYLLLTFSCLLFFTSCAASRSERKREEAKGKVAIEKISVAEDGKGVLVEASGPIAYTAFRLTDPDRLVLDIPEVDIKKVLEPIHINNEFITTITAASYGGQTIVPISRVEIGLKKGVIHDVKQGEGSIMVTVDHEADTQQTASVVEDQGAEVAKREEPNALVAEEPTVPPPPSAEGKEVKKADKLLRIEAQKENGATVIKIVGNGAIGNFNAFDMKKAAPPRLVVDVWNVKNSIPKTSLAVNTSHIRKVRVGQYPDKVRLVFDSNQRTLPNYTIEKVENSLVITTGNVDVKKQETNIAATPNIVTAITTVALNVRQGPDKTFKQIATLPKDTARTVVGRNTDSSWLQIHISGATDLGWVSKQFVKVQGDINSLPVAEPTEAVAAAQLASEPPVALQKTSELPAVGTEPYAEVKEIDFKQLADKARLVLMLSKKAAYQLSKSADETSLVLDIKDAIIADKFQRTLDASDLNTPVATISSFQSPVEPAKDVRILVKLKEKSSYDISQEGEKIQIDFPLQLVAQAVPKEAEVKPEEKNQESEAMSQEPKEIKQAEEVSKAEQEPAPDRFKPGQASGYTGRKISLDFKDADIGNILRLMAEISKLNIIAGEDVKGKVSLRLIEVPWDQAFDIILKTNGLGMVQEGNVVRILPVAKIKQESDEALASKKAKEKLEDLDIKLVPVNYATAGTLESQVKSLLSDRGTITVEARTNTLIIRDIPVNIAKAVDLIRKLDTQTPQVLIEARIIEANSNFARDLGVQWGAATLTRSQESFNSTFGSLGTSPSATMTPTGFIGSTAGVSRFSAQPGFAVSLPAAGAAGTLGAVGLSFGTLTGDPWLLDLRISAGEKQGLTKTISRPRITTLDNKEAKISQGDSVPFETTSSSGTQTSFIDATLELTVTPHITPDGSVSMKITAKRNSIGSFRSAAGTPSISKKEATTEIIVKDGETAVIGGIVVADKSDTSSGIPFFKDIPILGWLFKNNSTADSQTELLIFITPNIVKGKVELS